MTMDISTAIQVCWIVTGAVWLFALVKSKRTVRAQNPGARVFYTALIALAFFLLASPDLDGGWLGTTLIRGTRDLALAGLGLTAGGCLYAIWARVTLGANWSARPAVKEGHELIMGGPYSLTRHPIYSGLLLASVGTALVALRVRSFLGLALVLVALFIKIAQEEQLMVQTFPEAYPAYRRRVKALIPGIF